MRDCFPFFGRQPLPTRHVTIKPVDPVHCKKSTLS